MTLSPGMLRMHHFLPSSRSNGPGARAVLWVQGCTLGCPGCFNPMTHPSATGSDVEVMDLFNRIMKLQDSIEGITISGGEPLQQFKPILSLLTEIRAQTNLSSIIFTGYEWSEMERMPRFPDLTRSVDVIIAGRYDARQRLARGLLGSANKKMHLLTPRYQEADFRPIPQAEVVIDAGGDIVLTGIDPLIF